MEYLDTEEVVAFKESEDKLLKSRALQTVGQLRIHPPQRDKGRVGIWYKCHSRSSQELKAHLDRRNKTRSVLYFLTVDVLTLFPLFWFLNLYFTVYLRAHGGIFHVIKLLVSNLFVQQLYCMLLYANTGDLCSERGVRVN